MSLLTNLEAAEALGYTGEEECPPRVFNLIVPAANQYIRNATGKDWANDEEKDPVAKFAASRLVVYWFENPGMINKPDALTIDLCSQLHARVLIEKAGGAL